MSRLDPRNIGTATRTPAEADAAEGAITMNSDQFDWMADVTPPPIPRKEPAELDTLLPKVLPIVQCPVCGDWEWDDDGLNPEQHAGPERYCLHSDEDAELAQAAHVLQSFVIQHMLQRLAPGEWGAWFEESSGG